MKVKSVNGVCDDLEYIVPDSHICDFEIIFSEQVPDGHWIEVFFEDYMVRDNCIEMSNDGKTLHLKMANYFGESFGLVELFIVKKYINSDGEEHCNKIFETKIEVLNTKFDFKDIENMLHYLFSGRYKNKSSLGKMKSKMFGDIFSNSIPLAKIDEIKVFIDFIYKNIGNFSSILNKKKTGDRQKDFRKIIPQEVMKSPYKLNISDKKSDVRINGFFFKFNNNKSKKIKECDNFSVEENVFILNFLLLLSEKIEVWIKNYSYHVEYDQKNMGKYSDVILLFTSKKILIDLKKIKDDLNFVLNFFLYEIKVEPKIVNIKNFKFLRKDFYSVSFDFIDRISKDLDFNFEGNAILKMQTCDKMYEYYCLYSMLDYFERKSPESCVFSDDKDGVFDISLESVNVKVEFNQKIRNIASSKNSCLVDCGHSKNSSFTYVPDFVLSIFDKYGNLNKILILDSKYSKIQTVERYRMKDIIEKYYTYVSVFEDGSYSKNKIQNISAIFPHPREIILGYKNSNIKHFNPSFIMIGTPLNETGFSWDFLNKWIN